MSHRKVHSQGSVPFSWEAMPGVSKITNQDCPTDFGVGALNCLSAEEVSVDSPKKLVNNPEIKIPLPPCPLLKAPSRSSSTKGLRWHVEADPFLLAYKECTRSTNTLNNNSDHMLFGLCKTYQQRLLEQLLKLLRILAFCLVMEVNFQQPVVHFSPGVGRSSLRP